MVAKNLAVKAVVLCGVACLAVNQCVLEECSCDKDFEMNQGYKQIDRI